MLEQCKQRQRKVLEDQPGRSKHAQVTFCIIISVIEYANSVFLTHRQDHMLACIRDEVVLWELWTYSYPEVKVLWIRFAASIKRPLSASS